MMLVDPTPILLTIGLTLAGAFIPIVVLEYRLRTVPRRLREIESFMCRDVSEGKKPVDDDRGKRPAWHYARLFTPDLQSPKQKLATDDEWRFRNEFWRYHGASRYLIPLPLLTILSVLILVFTSVWLAEQLGLRHELLVAANPAPDLAAKTGVAKVDLTILMALWGALVWSMYEVLSRRMSGDLTPIELYGIALRLVSAIPIGYAFSLLAGGPIPPLAAFIASAFPLRDVRQIFRKYGPGSTKPDAAAASSVSIQGKIATVISGVGDDMVIRLEELGIVTHQDLAYADPIRLMIQTGVPLRLVLAWIDMALLAVYMGSHIPKLLKVGIPCALDACAFYVSYCWDVNKKEYKEGWEENQAVKDLAAILEVSPSILVRSMLNSVFNDPHTQFLI